VFVTVQHTIEAGGELKLEEEHDIVYRDAPQAGARPQQPQLAPEREAWSRTVDANAVMLFRYSALTFNGHRIHYDYPYVTRAEGYPGLVVHGPLIATLLVDLVRREQPQATLQSFAFKALRPTFAGQAFKVCGQPSADGKTIELWAKDHEGFLTMRATAVTTGYGPEIYSSAAPLKGAYLVSVNYYGSGSDRSDMTVAQVTIITNENTPNEKSETVRVPMRKAGELTLVKTFVMP
jgi:acyl dehydratase